MRGSKAKRQRKDLRSTFRAADKKQRAYMLIVGAVDSKNKPIRKRTILRALNAKRYVVRNRNRKKPEDWFMAFDFVLPDYKLVVRSYCGTSKSPNRFEVFENKP